MYNLICIALLSFGNSLGQSWAEISQFKEYFNFLFSNVQEGRTSPLIKGRVLYKDIVKDSNSKAEI